MAETTIKLPTKRDLIHEKYDACESARKLNDHGHELAKRKMLSAAITAFRRAVALAPDNPIIISGLGAVLFDSCFYDEAEKMSLRAKEIEPEYAPIYGNLGAIYAAQGRYDEAKKSYRIALKMEPDFVDARWNFAMCLLDNGDWKEAWPLYESRKIASGPRLCPQLPYPEWRGEDLSGKTLFVQGEQGVGDRILFSRYLHWIKEQHPACRILFMPNAEDLPNISNFMWGFRDVVDFMPNGIPWPEADYGIYLMSIPAVHGTTPARVPADPGLLLKNALRHKKSVELPGVDKTMLKVGVAWTGNPAMKRNNERSIPFDLIMELAELPSVVLYGLQFGTQDIERRGADQLICDLTPDIKPLGFTGTAATMLNLDLVITCCTATAHVAGVLGVPCWTLLCQNPYWLWLHDGRLDSVWYPGTRLVRQKKMFDWKPVMAEVKQELETLSQRRDLLEAAE